MRLLRAALTAAALVVGIGNAGAFEVDGVRAGMSLAEVRSAASRRGVSVLPVPGLPGVYALAYSSSPSHATISFCQNRDALFAYTADSVAGYDAFVRMIERETSRLGPGTTTAAVTETRNGPIYRLTVAWSESWWTVDVAGSMLPGGVISASRAMTAFSNVCR